MPFSQLLQNLIILVIENLFYNFQPDFIYGQMYLYLYLYQYCSLE